MTLACGDKVRFRATVWVCQDPVWEGTFVCWYPAAPGNDVVALCETLRGETHVRWSLVEGIDSPEGLI